MNLILLLSILLVVQFILLKRRQAREKNICHQKLISSGEFQFGVRVCHEWCVCLERIKRLTRLKTMVPFIYWQIWSAEGKVHPRSSSLTSARWIWVETSLGPAALHLFAQEPARKRNIQSPFWALCLGFPCHLSQTAGNYWHQSQGRAERGKVCLSSKIIVFASVTVRDTSGLGPQLSCTGRRSFGFSWVTHVLRKQERMGYSSRQYLGVPGGIPKNSIKRGCHLSLRFNPSTQHMSEWRH